MPTARVVKDIQAPPERVFATAMDLRNYAGFIRGIDTVEMLTEGPIGVGTRWRETRTFGGRQATEEMWITRFDAPKHVVVEAESHGTHYRSEFRFEPEGTGTRLSLTFTGTPKSGLARIFGFLGRMMTASVTRALERDLDDIQRACESADA